MEFSDRFTEPTREADSPREAQPAAQSPDELFDVCDENDVVVGQATRGEVHRRNLIHRAVHILVVRSSGEVVLQMRSAAKDQFPSTWTSSASGHVDAGESYDQAARRELAEELGFDAATIAGLQSIAKDSACIETGWEHVMVYRLRTDAPLTPDPVEIERLEERSLDAWLAAYHRQPAAFSPSVYLLEKYAAELR